MPSADTIAATFSALISVILTILQNIQFVLCALCFYSDNFLRQLITTLAVCVPVAVDSCTR